MSFGKGVMKMKASSLSLVGFGLLAGLTSVLTAEYSIGVATESPQLKLVWSDEFNGAAGSLPDATKWSIVTGGGG